MLKNTLLVAVCAVVLAVAVINPVRLWGEVKPKAVIGKNQPLQVDADRLDAYNDKKTAVFSGNVVASQGGRTIYAEQVTIYYREDGKALGQPSASAKDSNSIEKITAKGNVKVIEGERMATGDDAVFDQDAQKITMTGNAVLKEGKNIIKGSKVVIFLQENRGVVESGEKKRVSATIYPDEKK
jgi:lipopolysaccharide export system protein LptA